MYLRMLHMLFLVQYNIIQKIRNNALVAQFINTSAMVSLNSISHWHLLHCDKVSLLCLNN